MNLLATRSRKPAASKSNSVAAPIPNVKKEDVIPTLDEFIAARDYTGAVTLLDFMVKTGDETNDTLPWLAYSYFHLGEFQKAFDVYSTLLDKAAGAIDPTLQSYHLYRAACLFYLEQHEEALIEVRRGPANMLQNRIMLHCAHKLHDEALLSRCVATASKGGAEDLITLAAMQFDAGQFQDATDAYQSVLKEYPDYAAVQLYLALCCYRLDHFKFALEFLSKYLHQQSDSASALNLRACALFRLFDTQPAAQQLRELSERLAASSLPSPPAISHNAVVIRGGEDALQVLPPLVDLLPEARFNLVVFHLQAGALVQAHALVKDMEPSTPQEFIIKGVCLASMAVEEADPDVAQALQQDAERYLHAVGSSSSEKDTIAGRKCMAQLHFMQQRWSDVILYLGSIEEYCSHDPACNYNLGIACAASGDFEGGLRRLQLVEGPLAAAPEYVLWTARALVYTGDATGAWQLYLDTDAHYSLSLLRSLAADCYKCGHFFIAAKAYDMLCKLDGGENFIEGRRGACVGVLQQVLADRQAPEALRECVAMLGQEDDDAEVCEAISAWASEHGVEV